MISVTHLPVPGSSGWEGRSLNHRSILALREKGAGRLCAQSPTLSVAPTSVLPSVRPAEAQAPSLSPKATRPSVPSLSFLSPLPFPEGLERV